MSGRAAATRSSPIITSKSRPNFLRATLAHLRARDIDIITIDEMHQRLIERDFSRRFACFTFDDGYRDNRDFALPVMREFDAPFTVYVASDFAEGHRPAVVGRAGTGDRQGRCDRGRRSAASPSASMRRRRRQAGRVRPAARLAARLPGERDVRREISALCARHGVDEAAICRELCMSWDELKPFADDPLVTIGAHTISHCNLAKQSEEIASHEMATSRARIEARPAAPGRASRLSLWRQERGRRARIRAGARSRIQDRGDDAAGHDLCRKRRASDRAAAGVAERQLSGRAHSCRC